MPGLIVKLRGASRPWREVKTPLEAVAAIREAIDFGLSRERIIVLHAPGTGRELPIDGFPWGLAPGGKEDM